MNHARPKFPSCADNILWFPFEFISLLNRKYTLLCLRFKSLELNICKVDETEERLMSFRKVQNPREKKAKRKLQPTLSSQKSLLFLRDQIEFCFEMWRQQIKEYTNNKNGQIPNLRSFPFPLSKASSFSGFFGAMT